MIELIGIFVITSSACFVPTQYSNELGYRVETGEDLKCVKKFIRVSQTSTTAYGETSSPVCDWISHQWIEIYNYKSNHELNQCIYCNRKRIKKEVWEDVK